jgi:hypothetical protein
VAAAVLAGCSAGGASDEQAQPKSEVTVSTPADEAPARPPWATSPWP